MSLGRRLRRHRRRLVVIAVTSLVLLAGSITAVVVVLSYAHAASLSNQGGVYGWEPPDNLTSHDVQLGPYQGIVTQWRPGQRQAFIFNITNTSGVTQTILGLADQSYLKERLQISAPDQNDMTHVQYEPALPVSIPPNDTRVVRFSMVPYGCHPGDHTYWQDIALRVRVGWFTRTETVNLSNVIFELQGSAKYC